MLDPDDWEDLRRLGHRMVDDVIDGCRTVRETPVWQPVPPAVRERLNAPLPREALGPERAYAEFKQYVGPYPRGNTHPRFWGWVNGSGLPLGVFADMLASAMNASVSGFECAATMVEEQVLDWLKEMLGFPARTSALLTSGCSMSNIIGLAVARASKATCNVRRDGLWDAAPLALYASREAHSSIRKAVELLGLGTSALREIPVDHHFRMDVEALQSAIDADRKNGVQPFCVVATAGTVNTGAVDHIERLADACAAHALWLHVDGAFGALAWLCPELRPMLTGLQRADSLAFDLHKWMYLPYDVGCSFVRDAQAHHDAFALAPTYLSRTAGGAASHPTSFADRGIELTRRFRALKIWMALKAYGVAAFEQQIRQNVEQAFYLADCVKEHPELELMAPVSLNVVCFRYAVPGVGDEVLNSLNKELLTRLQMSGVALPSHTTLDGRFTLRAANTNHRSERRDFDILVESVAKIGAELRMSLTLPSV